LESYKFGHTLSSQSEKCKVIGQTCHVIELAAASSTTALAPDQAPSVHDPTANDRARQETQTPLKYKLESEGVGAKVIWNGPGDTKNEVRVNGSGTEISAQLQRMQFINNGT